MWLTTLIYQIIAMVWLPFMFCHDGTAWTQSAYRDFLRRDSSQQNSYLTGGYHFIKVPHPVNFRADGIYFHLGVNAARLFSKKIILGFCIDYKGAKGIFGWKTGTGFATDFSTSYQALTGSSADSAKSQILYNALTSSEKAFVGNYISNIGIMFSPFPQKYGGVMVQVKRGLRSFPVDGYYGNPYIENFGSDYAFLDLRKVYGASIYFKPFTISKRSVNESFEKSLDEWRHKIIIGIHYERLNLAESNFYGISIPQLVTADFMSANGFQHHVGFSVGIGIY